MVCGCLTGDLGNEQSYYSKIILLCGEKKEDWKAKRWY